MPDAAQTQTHSFQAEVDALLRLVTESLYTEREVFLRELVSNAADALDKARFLALTDKELRPAEGEPRITIEIDKAARTLSVEDNGVGMTSEELVEHLGKIAHSGTARFLQQAARDGKADLSLIGQFGVGFYAAFMVADEVVVETLSARAGAEPARWASRGDGTFTISPGERGDRGTRVTLHLKEGADEFLERARVEAIVRRYSNYVMYPIVLRETGAEGDEAPQINAARAFWTRAPKDLSDEDYQEFYTHVMGGFVLPGDEPLARLHISADAPIQFHAVLFVPARAPLDLFSDEQRGIQLYARRVLIMEHADKLLPAYLRFVRGVVDSEDLPLNVSRETLQDHRAVSAIRRQLTRKMLGRLEEVAQEDPERYEKIWREFGSILKEGIHTDNGHRDQLARLLRYPTTTSGGALVTLDAYVDAMPDDQEAIYYITGTPDEDLARSPHLEACRARGHAVLLMTDPVDEWVVMGLSTYRDKPLRDVTQGEWASPDGEDTEDGEQEAPSPGLAALIARAQEVLGERVREVRVSKRLRESAACLVVGEGGLGRNMERILRAANRPVPSSPKILELNPEHRFVRAAARLAQEHPEDPRLSEWIELLHDQANLAQGCVPDPAGTVRRMQAVLDHLLDAAPAPEAGGES